MCSICTRTMWKCANPADVPACSTITLFLSSRKEIAPNYQFTDQCSMLDCFPWTWCAREIILTIAVVCKGLFQGSLNLQAGLFTLWNPTTEVWLNTENVILIGNSSRHYLVLPLWFLLHQHASRNEGIKVMAQMRAVGHVQRPDFVLLHPELSCTLWTVRLFKDGLTFNTFHAYLAQRSWRLGLDPEKDFEEWYY